MSSNMSIAGSVAQNSTDDATRSLETSEDVTQEVLAAFLSKDAYADPDSEPDDITEPDAEEHSIQEIRNDETPLGMPAPNPPSDPSSDSSSNHPLDAEFGTFGASSSRIPPMVLAVGLLFELTGGSREDYLYTREVFELMRLANGGASDDSGSLPPRLDILKRMVRNHLPMLQLMRKQLPVVSPEQALVARSGRDHKTSHLYWYDPASLLQAILGARDLPIYFGMGEFVRRGIELWQSRSWTSSALACSGEFIRALDGNIILPGDIVHLTKESAIDQIPYDMVRILEFGRSYIDGHDGAVMVRYRPVVSQEMLPVEIKDTLTPSPVHGEYLVLSPPERYMYLNPDKLQAVADLHLDWQATKRGGETVADPNRPARFIMREIEYDTKVVTFLRHTHPTRAELEILCLGRSAIEDMAVDATEQAQQVRSIPFSLIIDKSLKFQNVNDTFAAMYLVPAGLPYPERRKPANNFTLSVGPQEVDLEEITKALEPAFEKLRKGILVDILGESVLLVAFPIVITGDMTRQAGNGGYLRHNARSISRPDKDRRRTHYETIYHRQSAGGPFVPEASHSMQVQGIGADSSLSARLAPMLDLVLGLGVVPPHTEIRGVGTVIHAVLFCSILSKEGREMYNAAFQNFPVPKTWSRIQSPALHMASWSSTEAARAIVMIPLVLRSHGKLPWYNQAYIQAVVGTPKVLRGGSPIVAIIDLFARIAQHTSNVTSNMYYNPNEIANDTLSARVAYIQLLDWADTAGGSMDSIPAPFEANIAVDDADYSDVSGIVQAMADLSAEAAQDISDVTAGAEPSRKQSKLSQIGEWLSLPSIGNGMHIVDIAREYGTVFNCNVLPGELKRNLLMGDADSAAPHMNLMIYVLGQDLVKQSTQLGVSGWWLKYEAINEALNTVRTHCPKMIRALLPSTERDSAMLIDDNEADSDIEEGATEVERDDDHKRARVFKRGLVISPANNHLGLTPSMVADNLEEEHPFKELLRTGLSINYNLKDMPTISEKRIRWYQQLAATEPGTNRRWIFNVGDIINARYEDENGALRQTAAKILQFFTVRPPTRPLPLVLAVVCPLTNVRDSGVNVNDLALHFQVTQWDPQNSIVVGLDAIAYRPVWMVPAAQGVGGLWERHVQNPRRSRNDTEWKFHVRILWDVEMM